MHFAARGYWFVALTALLGIAGTWSDDAALANAWMFPAFLLLAGLAAELWYAQGTTISLRMLLERRLQLGRRVPAAFVFAHNRQRVIELQYAQALPPALLQTSQVECVALAPLTETRAATTLTPLKLGAARFVDVPARLLGRFGLAWWSRLLPQDARFTVAPDSLQGGARAVAGESAGETPRRLPGSGVELLQLRDYASGDALTRIDWKATARHGSLVSREYSEAQHLEILIVIDAGRASRVRAGVLDRLGLYANVAARLAEHAVSVEDRVGLLVYAERTLSACMPERGLRAVMRLRRSLETLESERGESNPVSAAIQVRRMLRHRGLVVWLTDLAEPARTDELLRALKALVPRHQPVIAAPHAPQIVELANAPASHWRDPAIRYAAREHQRRAQLQVAQLRRQGIVVLDEPDDQLDRAVLDAYLNLRRRRRI